MDIHIEYARIGAHFRKAREQKGWTQAQIAEALGVAVNTYNSMERGQLAMNLRRIIQLCTVLEIRPGSVLDDCCDELIDIAYHPAAPECEEKKALRLLVDKCSDETADLLNTVGQAVYYAYSKRSR